LLSGTAIKAVVAYVSDYISKPSLKTHLIFEAVRSVFDKNSEMLGSTLDKKEKAHKLLTQIVNNLTSKMEIGGPMASMYLLGNPDHYTGHLFQTFYWPNYVHASRFAWHGDSECYDDDQMVLLKIKGKIVDRTKAQDYVFRPDYFANMTLYDWVRLSVIEKRPKKDCNDINNDTFEDVIKIVDDMSLDDDSHIESKPMDHVTGFYQFLKDHLLSHTHHVSIVSDSNGWVPNFIGGALPRSDCGDREYYCSVMLSLFMPWCPGKDLKTAEQSWDDAFRDYCFTTCQLDVIKYFNIRYECLDARDDYAAQMKKS